LAFSLEVRSYTALAINYRRVKTKINVEDLREDIQ
jgi:hypothetical protein